MLTARTHRPLSHEQLSCIRRKIKPACGQKNAFAPSAISPLPSLAKPDNYYTQDQRIVNNYWYGKAAEILRLNGRVSTEEYNNAYQGLDNLGNPLRQRQSGKKCNPGRDITLSAPKSVSLLGLVKEDKTVIAVHEEAVKKTLDYIERNCIFTRTGKGGVNHLQTDNALFAVFQHDDNRNLDPQLHSHCVIFNLTQGTDGKWRSMDNRELYQQKMTIGMVYHHELGRRLQTLGYELNWNRDGTFDVRGYSPEQLKEFSTRQQEIDKAVGQEASAAAKAKACTTTRKSKVHQAESERKELRQIWQQKAEELDIKHPEANYRYQQVTNSKDKSKLVNGATEIVTEKQVAFPKHILLKESLRQSQGNYSLEDLEREINQSSSLIKTQDGRLTTKTAIDREKQIINLARNSKDKYPVLANTEIAHQQAQRLGLNKTQANALTHFVNNRDGVMLCQGDAGVGKTDTVKALKETISSETKMRGLAPSAAAAGSGKSLTVGKESFYVAASRAKQEFKVYTASTKALGLSIEKSRGQENALSLIMKQQELNQKLSVPSREQEFKLLMSAKYLVESKGVLDQNNLHLKSYKSLDGTEIKRDKDSLTITHQGKELIFR